MGLKEELLNRGFTVYRVSKEAGIPYSTLCDLVNDKTYIDNASVKTLARLSAYLGVTMDDLYGRMEKKDILRLKKHPNLPPELDESINNLISAVNNGNELIDCELSQVLGDINMSESWGLIDSLKAKELRKHYVFDVLDEIRKKEAVLNG